MVAIWQKTGLIIILTLICAKSAETVLPTESFSQLQFYKDFLMKIYDEEMFENCLIYGDLRKNETLALLLQVIVEDFKKPIIFQNANSFHQIADLFNRKILVIAQLESFEMELPVLAHILERMRQKRILVFGTELGFRASGTEKYLMQLFRLCEAEKILNVVVIFPDFLQTKVFHSYTIFPKFQLEQKTLGTVGVEVFPQRLKNLLGYGIRTMPDQIFPFTFAYKVDGHIKVGGYLPKLLEAFAKSINGTVSYTKQVVLDKYYYSPTILNMTRSNEMDIPMARMYLQVLQNFGQASNPFSITSVCVMTPVRWINSFADFYAIYSCPTYLVLIFIDTLSICTLFYLCRRLQYLRAGRRYYKNILSVVTELNYLSFCVDSNHPAYLKGLLTLCILVFLSMVWVLCVHTHFTANLNTFLTKPTMMSIPTDWDDLNKNGNKILISNGSYAHLSQWCGELCTNFEKYFIFVETEEVFRQQQHKLNTSYAYLVDVFSWYFIQLRMKSLKGPIFRLTDMCLRRQTINCLPLQPNSIFKESLNLFLTRILDHGLKQFWIDAAYLEAIRTGKMHNITYTEEVLRPLNMEYISFAWSMFGFAWTLAIFIFACEIIFRPKK